MAVPKVNLRTRKCKKSVSYFIDFAVDGKRYRKAAGTSKKTATEIAQRKQSELTLGHFDIHTYSEKTITFEDLIKGFLSSKRNHIRASPLINMPMLDDGFTNLCIGTTIRGRS